MSWIEALEARKGWLKASIASTQGLLSGEDLSDAALLSSTIVKTGRGVAPLGALSTPWAEARHVEGAHLGLLHVT